MSTDTKEQIKEKNARLYDMKIGQRGEYHVAPGISKRRCEKLGILCWYEKRKTEITSQDKALRQFIDIPVGYEAVYGITYKGKDYDCGSMPRDLGTVIKGIEIGTESQEGKS